jgi:hypothetical protein
MPPLWREVLSLVHPVELPEPPRSDDGVLRWTRFPDWRLRDIPATQRLVDGPVEGLLFDVEQNGFWWRSWGVAPEAIENRSAKARTELAQVPKLTPLWNHLYAGSTDDSPVFSIVQADLSVPALTLVAMVSESAQSETDLPPEQYPVGNVPFWRLLHAYSQIGHLSSFGDLTIGGM